MEYLHEHLNIGRIGILSIITFFIASLFASILYFKLAFGKLANADNKSLLSLARGFFLIHFFAIVIVFFSLYIILVNHYFEFHYAYQHSNLDLPLRYILSCFWEGQEGSFLLWSFWNGGIGLFFIWRFKKWEKEVLCIVATLQVLLSTMVLGVDIFGYKIGNNPFLLLRNAMSNAPIFAQADYILKIKDGIGLNALLQNYWMVIHPPILFLGFSLFTYPFAFVISSLIKKNFTAFSNDILLWTLLAAGVLGLGVMMGAAWAYESLTFGGYWAWDPVENASLVPWLIIVSALHLNLIFNKTTRSLRTTILFYLLSFILVIYSSYLTRSGVLGDSSVHAFTGAGIGAQLLVFLLICSLPPLLLFIVRYKNIPTVKSDEKSNSREFLMFIGSTILFFSACIISIKTSLPVINKILHTTFAPPIDVEFGYNSNQIFVALLITLFSGLGFFYKFKTTNYKDLKRHLWIPIIISLVVGVLLIIFIPLTYYAKGLGFHYSILITFICSIFSICANAYYLFAIVKNNFSKYGGGISHIGFAVLITGILISASQKKVLSWNTTSFSPLQANSIEKPLENITLIKNLRTDMGTYHVTFLGNDSVDNRTQTFFYNIYFENKYPKASFSLYPDVIKNTKNQEGLTPNPAAKHYWNKDIFVYLTYVQDTDNEKPDTSNFKKVSIKINDTFFYSTGWIHLSQVTKKLDDHVVHRNPALGLDTGITAYLTVADKNGSVYIAHPSIAIKNQAILHLPDTVIANNLIFNLNRLLDNSKFEIAYKESQKPLEFITLKVFEFPFINLVWLGTIIMVIGFGISATKRYKSQNKKID